MIVKNFKQYDKFNKINLFTTPWQNVHKFGYLFMVDLYGL